MSGASQKPKIYCFVDSVHEGRGGGVSVVSVAEDGACLAGHFSSDTEWAKHDIGLTSDWKHDIYTSHYPGGFELVWLDDPSKLPRVVIERNHARAGPRDDGG